MARKKKNWLDRIPLWVPALGLLVGIPGFIMSWKNMQQVKANTKALSVAARQQAGLMVDMAALKQQYHDLEIVPLPPEYQPMPIEEIETETDMIVGDEERERG